MGNSQDRARTDSSIEEALRTAESLIGKVAITGRFHMMPKRFEDYYSPTKQVLGKGYNGEVFMARDKTTGAKFAVKPFNLIGISQEKREELEAEMEIFLAMDHPHVARLTDCFETRQQIIMVMECMDGGELFQRIVKEKRFNEDKAAEAVHQMLLAVNYLHKQNIVHRDLKLENFLYESAESQHLKLIDFGFSKIWNPSTKMQLSCGTLSYVAPEVLRKSYTNKCDLWSMGVITFILLVGYMPFSGSEQGQICKIKAGDYKVKQEKWDNVSTEGFDFVKLLLNKDSSTRLSAEQAMEHEWIRKNRSVPRKTSVDLEMVSSLTDYAKQSQFRRSVFQVMAWSLTNDERTKVRQAFLEMDKNKAGTITMSEMRDVLHTRFHIADDTVKEIFAAMDGSEDEEIHYAEFLAAMCSTRIKLHDQLLQATFQRFDVDGTGFISKENLKEVLGNSMTDAEIDAALVQLDKDKNGQISYDEFMRYLKDGDHAEHHAEGAARLVDKLHAQEMGPVAMLQRPMTPKKGAPGERGAQCTTCAAGCVVA